MDLRLDGKVALVTGSSRGIGKGIAEEFARSGADVTITYDGDESGAEETADYVRGQGRRALIVQVDVADEAAVDRLYEAHLAEFGRLDIMVNNAAVMIPGKIHEIPTSTWRTVLGANLDGAFFCMSRAARQMIAQGNGGRIIAISSVHEEASTAGSGAYSVSKAGLRNLMRTMAVELGEYGITVNGIAPGMTVTPGMNTEIYNDEREREKRAQLIVLKRAGYPQDIANMAVFLASDAASYCTGATYYVDGGWMLTRPPV
jgi:glucose 1-dehydrogenase